MRTEKIHLYVLFGIFLSISHIAFGQSSEAPNLSFILEEGPDRSKSQLTVTPTSTYTVNSIQIVSYSSTNGTCAGLTAFNNIPIGGGNGNSTLTSGHSYVTTDASNYALNQADSNYNFQTDIYYQLKCFGCGGDVGSSTCIAPPGSGACTSSSNCGWGSPQTWDALRTLLCC